MLRLTPYGWREIIGGTLILLVLGVVLGWVWWPLGLLVLPVFIWLLAFFRDPVRVIPTEPGILVSPADGTVSDITEIESDPRLGGPAVRIGIFLSVFNVHVNRSPCDAKVLSVTYNKGKFINAMKHHEASEFNENNTVVLGDPTTNQPIVVVRQIVGLIARRIVFPNKVGDQLQRGQHIGMMKFGSRTELYVPRSAGPEILVKVGDKVAGGSDILVRLGKPVAPGRVAAGAAGAVA